MACINFTYFAHGSEMCGSRGVDSLDELFQVTNDLKADSNVKSIRVKFTDKSVTVQ